MPSLRELYDALPWRRGSGPASARTVFETNGTSLAAPPPPPPTPTIPRQGVVVPIDQGRRRPDTTGREYGASGTENFGGYIRNEDYNPDLDNFVSAVRYYEKMKRGDAQIRAMLSVLKLPLRGATWTALAADEGDPVDQAIADFVNNCLFDDDAMEFSWDFTLRHILLQLEYGFSALEKVWRVDDQGAYRLLRLAPRLPKTVLKWHVDRNGRLLAMVQWAPVPTSTTYTATGAVSPGGSSRSLPALVAGANGSNVSPFRYETTVTFRELTIPADYLAVFTLEREGDNYEGLSVLRAVYRNWFYKDQAYHLEGVRLDRWGVGIPVAKLSEGHALTQDDLNALVEVLKKVRANERAFLISPPNVEYDLLPKGGQTGAGSSGAIEWINHHDAQIVRSVLAGFLTMGQDPHGTLGFGSRLTDMFISSLQGVANGVSADLKHQVVRQLCNLNFDMTNRKYPRIVCRDLEQVDMDNLIKALTAFGGAQTAWIQPDDDSEKLLRKMLQLPPLKAELSRKAKSNAAPGTEAAHAAAHDPNDPAAANATADPSHDPASGHPADAPPTAPDAPIGARATPTALHLRGAADLESVSARIDALNDVIAAMRRERQQPIEVHVAPPSVSVEAPHVETHLTIPQRGSRKFIHDTDPASPTFGNITEVRDDDSEPGYGIGIGPKGDK
jgi:hypothetical protein